MSSDRTISGSIQLWKSNIYSRLHYRARFKNTSTLASHMVKIGSMGIIHALDITQPIWSHWYERQFYLFSNKGQIVWSNIFWLDPGSWRNGIWTGVVRFVGEAVCLPVAAKRFTLQMIFKYNFIFCILDNVLFLGIMMCTFLGCCPRLIHLNRIFNPQRFSIWQSWVKLWHLH